MRLNEDFWNEKYLNNETAWDLKHPSDPLKEYIDQLEDKNIKILIPGCGNAYEAEYLLEKGFKNIVLIDISEVVVKKIQIKFKNNHNIKVIHQDFFKLKDKFDLILEQTFFCAINPNLRKAYAHQMHQLLNERGRLVGILFNKEFENSKPPYGGSIKEYEIYFSDYFYFKNMEQCYNSIKPRRGNELFINLIKR